MPIFAALVMAIIVATPWIDERLSPPFGRSGVPGPSDTRGKLLLGIVYLLFLLIVASLCALRRRRSERPRVD
jgi:hypothetical protein